MHKVPIFLIKWLKITTKNNPQLTTPLPAHKRERKKTLMDPIGVPTGSILPFPSFYQHVWTHTNVVIMGCEEEVFLLLYE
jgi:hypothetical protein